MTAFWLTYKPLTPSSPRGWPPEEMDALVSKFEADPTTATPLWRMATTRRASAGDRVYIFKQGDNPRGIFGIGELIESPREQYDPTDIEGGLAPRARIRLTNFVNPRTGFLLDFDSVADVLPNKLVNAQQSGNRVEDDVALKLDERLGSILDTISPLTSEKSDDTAFDPDSVTDDRERAVRAIRIRRGQAEFRAALMAAYDGRCAITGCAVADVLEAAHIYPYAGKLTNHVSNGLLLRADIHTLFDCGLMAIDPVTRTVIIADSLKASSYEAMEGKPLRRVREAVSGPSKRNLERHFIVYTTKKHGAASRRRYD